MHTAHTGLRLALLLSCASALACDPPRTFEDIDAATTVRRDAGPPPNDAVIGDADGDGINDQLEGRSLNLDTDRDGTPDYLDLDSDNDGIPDSVEGVADTDGDGIPDRRDPDSDGDGLSDRDELVHGTSPTSGDTDGDGVSDLIEVASGTNPLDPLDNPRTRGNFVFVEPFEAPPSPERDILDFATNLRRADVYFLMDTTISMGGDIASLQSDLMRVLIPAIRTRIPEAQMGVGHYEDFPVGPHGSPGDVPYATITPITNVDADVLLGVMSLRLADGGNTAESSLPAMHAAVTGEPLRWSTFRAPEADPSCAVGRTGYACFRPDAVPIIVNFSDAPSHNGPAASTDYTEPEIMAPTYLESIAALNENRVRVITISSGLAGTWRTVGIDTGSVDLVGMPLVYETNMLTGFSLSDAVVEGIEAVSGTPLDISAVFEDDASDAVDTRVAFVDDIVPVEDGDAARGCLPREASDSNGDGRKDVFLRVPPGQRVCFRVVVRMNTTVMPTLVPQLFQGTVRVVGDGRTPLDARQVYFLVPPTIPEPGIF